MENKLFGEILGFIALSAPLLALVLILAGLVMVIWWFARRKQGSPRRWRRAVIAGAAFLLIFTWDVILGRAYFYYLCATDSGVKVYKQVELPAEYSYLEFPDSAMRYNQLSIANRYLIVFESEENITGPGNIDYSRDVLRDSVTNEILGDITNYSYGGGWFEKSISLHGGAGGGSCGFKDVDFRDFLETIFKTTH